MVKLSLDKTWKLCLESWNGIIKILEWGAAKDINIDVYDAKALWMNLNGYDNIRCNCFFCQYAAEHNGIWDGADERCSQCPGVLVDKGFDCELVWDWQEEPIQFYEELKRLNNKRLRKGKKNLELKLPNELTVKTLEKSEKGEDLHEFSNVDDLLLERVE